MSDPYRDANLACPACNKPLREFRTRQICDACEGMMVTLTDLAGAIHDLTSITPTFEYVDGKLGARRCPHCAELMTTCKLRVMLEDEIEKPRPELDRCDAHGIWFDAEELAKVFEKVATKGFGGGVGRKAGNITRAPAGAGNPGAWSAMFKKFGGHGGW